MVSGTCIDCRLTRVCSVCSAVVLASWPQQSSRDFCLLRTNKTRLTPKPAGHRPAKFKFTSRRPRNHTTHPAADGENPAPFAFIFGVLRLIHLEPTKSLQSAAMWGADSTNLQRSSFCFPCASCLAFLKFKSGWWSGCSARCLPESRPSIVSSCTRGNFRPAPSC